MPPSHRRCRQYNEQHESCLDRADRRKSLSAGGVDRLTFGELLPPPDEGDHRLQLEHQDEAEEGHLEEEQAVVDVVRTALFQAANARATPVPIQRKAARPHNVSADST